MFFSAFAWTFVVHYNFIISLTCEAELKSFLLIHHFFSSVNKADSV